MHPFQTVYVPIGVPTFHLESAETCFQASKELLSSLSPSVVFPEEMLLTMEKLSAFLDKVTPDLLIVQNITFANGAYMTEILSRFSCPILLWTLREPVIDGGRLRLNSLTGAYSAGNAIRAFRNEQEFSYVFGSSTEKKVQEKIKAVIAAGEAKHFLQGATLASLGQTPEGFGFGRALDLELKTAFGVNLIGAEVREFMDKARSYSKEEWEGVKKEAEGSIRGMEAIPEEQVEGFVRLYMAYMEFAKEKKVDAISSRCWPDYFTAYGSAVCAVLGRMNENGIPTACEGDTYGALSMLIASRLSKGPVFFGDPVSMEEKENTLTFWHCGTGACSLADPATGACAGLHCNRKIGVTLDFGCRPCEKVTVFRVGREADGKFRFFLASGKALEKPRQFTGTSVVVEMEEDVTEVVSASVTDGWEPHFVVAFADIKEELIELSKMLSMEVWEY